ncbi:hypothetical protein QVD17_27174 [Tagetes erecta]|uniref:Calcium-dependent protein kinase n=1 Tax=Tagetes erecta TaxID=13708 RepID=A0AAD8NR09_TARER|nr:hypothetical protein QVD17_27174 [Tagetes erecta]
MGSIDKLGAAEERRLTRKSSIILDEEIKDVNNDFTLSKKQLGSGKSAVIYICREKSTGKKYACKQIAKKRIVTEGQKEDLKREVRIMKYLQGQENVVELKGTYEDNTNVNIVMEYCEGGELYKKIESKGRCGRFTEKLAAQIISSIMKVVYSLHFMGVMHRDLKPENFVLPKKGTVLGFLPCLVDYTKLKAIDFGLSAFDELGNPNCEKVGTAFYVAPEVLRRQPYGKEVDIWSAGVILYMLLTGVPPFYGDTDNQIFEEVLKAKPDMESYPWPLISPNAKKLVKDMLSVDPNKRPTAAAVLNDLWLKDNGVSTENPIDKMFLDTMKHFRAMNKFKKLALKKMTEYLGPVESEELRAMFRNFDTNEQEAISREELEKWLVRIDPKLRPEDAKQIAKEADTNGDGYIDYNESLTAMMNFRKKHKQEDLRKAFEHFKKGSDDWITIEELKLALLEEYELDHATIEDIISEVDKNDDGKIDYKEFCAMIRS